MDKIDRIQALLACPDCRSPLLRTDKALVCKQCKRDFPVKNRVPILFGRDSKLIEGEGERCIREL